MAAAVEMVVVGGGDQNDSTNEKNPSNSESDHMNLKETQMWGSCPLGRDP